MAFTYDERTRKITVPQGDNVRFPITVTGAGDGALVVFKVRNITRGQWAIVKTATVDSGAAFISLDNNDTRGLPAKCCYGWTIGVVIGADIDVDGTISVNDPTDSVVTAFNAFAEFAVTDNGIMGESQTGGE